MKSEKEVKSMLKQLLIQMKQVGEFKNPVAYQRLEQRAVALSWQLELEKAPRTLVLSKEHLKFLSAFW